jgi:hypothetical protein
MLRCEILTGLRGANISLYGDCLAICCFHAQQRQKLSHALVAKFSPRMTSLLYEKASVEVG